MALKFKFELQKLHLYALVFFNLITFFYILINSMIRATNLATEILMLISFLTFIADMVYAALSKNKNGLYALVGIMILFIANFASVQLSFFSYFVNSIPVAGIIALLLIPIIGILTVLNVNFKINSKLDRGFRLFLFAAIPFILLFTVICAFNALFGGGGHFKYATDFFGLFLLILSLNVFLAYIRLYIDSKRKIDILAALVAVMFAYSFVSFAIRDTAFYGDLKENGEKPYGYESYDGLRKFPYSFADPFLGVPTEGIAIEKDVVYYVSDGEEDAGLALRYDLYYPTFEDANRSVLVNIHGMGVDKSFGPLAGRDKYFASRGYVVYDIQVGDCDEKGVNYTEGVESDAAYMLSHISEFFKYAVTHNGTGANFGSTFVTGMSMGGSLALLFGVSYYNDLEALGATIKGIMPLYPGYWPGEADWIGFESALDSDSVPCFTAMGLEDTVVPPDTIFSLLNLYIGAGNVNIHGITFKYAGHGFDVNFTGPENQIVTWGMERFMLRYR
jgi:Poly(3-hydroxybutyrate) depolymerase